MGKKAFSDPKCVMAVDTTHYIQLVWLKRCVHYVGEALGRTYPMLITVYMIAVDRQCVLYNGARQWKHLQKCVWIAFSDTGSGRGWVFEW